MLQMNFGWQPSLGCAALMVAAGAAASAEPIASSTVTPTTPAAESEPKPVRTEPAADDVAGAPLPGQESGRTDPGDGGDSTLRKIGRDALFLPRMVIDLALDPIRGGIWAYDRFQLDELYYRVFFNKARTIGLTPTFDYDSYYGLSGVVAGGRFVARDLFGEHEHLALAAATGTIYRQIYSAELRSGDRLGERFHLALDGGFEQSPRQPFYGIGNGDAVATPTMLIDPTNDETAVATAFRQQRVRVSLAGDTRVWRRLHVRAAAAVSELDFGRSEAGTMPIDLAYNTSRLAGWDGVRYGYGELELRWDDRDTASALEPRAIFAGGSLAAAYVGREVVVDGGRDFTRYGVDLQHFVRLGEGPRVLALRLHGEGVTGTLEDVPFTELPKLGGLTYLRGYQFDRFRDRVAAFGSAEYEWDLGSLFSASMFVDAGRVYDSLDALSLDHLRAGFGAGIEAHSEGSFVVQASLASSIDGGVFFNLAFNPVFTIDERVRRR
jgi:hypothetical protein